MNQFYKFFQLIVLFVSHLLCIPIYSERPAQPQVIFSGFTFTNEVVNKNEMHGKNVGSDFSYNVTWNESKDHNGWMSKNNLKLYTAQDFQRYFAEHGYAETKILNQRFLYMFDEFVKYAQTYTGYKDIIQKLHAELKNLNLVQKTYYMVNGKYCRKLQKRICSLYNSLQTIKIAPSISDSSSSYLNLISNSLPALSAQFTEYKILEPVYDAYMPFLSHAITKRFEGYPLSDATFVRISKPYSINDSSQQILVKYGYDTNHFTECTGNQLQHIIHQESLDILDCITSLSCNSILYDHQEALVDLTVAMVDYNHATLLDKAMHIGDLCWSLLDYGQAIMEGAALGLYSAVHDILTNPIETTVSIVAGKQVLAFQLCKVLYNVADIGATAITNFDAAQEKWNTYIEPLNNIIDAINKKEITIRDAIKNGTAFVVGYKAQGKLLGGLGKLCNSIKHKSINFVKNNLLVHPQEYLTTPEGLLFKATGQSVKLRQATPSKLKNSVDDKVFRHQSIKGLLKKARLPTKGKLRYVPPKKLRVAEGLPQVVWHDRRRGFVDRFGNIWLKGESRTQGHDFEWDVQLSKQGIQQVGWMTRDNSHLNVSLDGRVTHK